MQHVSQHHEHALSRQGETNNHRRLRVVFLGVSKQGIAFDVSLKSPLPPSPHKNKSGDIPNRP